jgi:hypothetical protein
VPATATATAGPLRTRPQPGSRVSSTGPDPTDHHPSKERE